MNDAAGFAPAAFVAVGQRLLEDGTLMVEVKYLGCASEEAGPGLSSTFNRRRGEVHLCSGEAGDCVSTHEAGLHLCRKTFPASAPGKESGEAQVLAEKVEELQTWAN